MNPTYLLLLFVALCANAQELRLSNNTIAENLPAGTEVGRFFSDSFDAEHYLPGIHAIAASGQYLYYLEDEGELRVVDIGGMWDSNKEAPVPTLLMKNGAIHLGAHKGLVFVVRADGTVWSVDVQVRGVLQERKVVPDFTMLEGEEAEEAMAALSTGYEMAAGGGAKASSNTLLQAKGNNWVASIRTGEDEGLWVQKLGRGSLPNGKPIKIEQPGAIFRPAGTDNYLFQVSGSRLVTRCPVDFEGNGEHRIFVRSTDGRGRDVRKSFTIKVTDKPEPPSKVITANGKRFEFPENSKAGTLVADLRIVDQDRDETHTVRFSKAPEREQNDNDLFRIQQGEVSQYRLFVAQDSLFDFEGQKEYLIHVEVKDKDGLSLYQAIPVRLTNVNESPLPPTLEARQVSSQTIPGSLAGVIRGRDPDMEDTLAFHLDGSADDNARFTIHQPDGSGEAYLLTAPEAQPLPDPANYKVRILVTDAGGLESGADFEIQAGEPVQLALDIAEVPENAKVGAKLGRFETGERVLVHFPGVRRVAAGGKHKLYVKGDGSLWSVEERSRATMVVPSGVVDVEAGNSHAVYLKQDGSVWGLGENSDGQLGKGDVDEDGGPVEIMEKGAKQIWADGKSTYIRMEDGSLVGLGHVGKLPGLFTENKVIPILTADNRFAHWILEDGSLWRSKLLTGSATLVFPSGVKDFATTNSGHYLLDQDGDLRQWESDAIQPVQKPIFEEVQDFKVSGTTVMALKTDGSLWETRIKTDKTIRIDKARVQDFAVAGDAVYCRYDGSLGYLLGNPFGPRPEQRIPIPVDAIPAKGTDNGLFVIRGRDLFLARPLPRNKDSLSIHVLGKTEKGQKVEKAFTILVHEVEEAPVSIQLSENEIPEDTPGGKSVGKLTATDPDHRDETTFQLVAPGEGLKHHNHLYQIEDLPGLRPMLVLKDDAELDHETQPVHSVYIRATDSTGLQLTQRLKVKVTNVSEPPAAIHLDHSTIPQNLAAWARAATITAIDDPGDAPYFSLVEPDDGSRHDNALFEIDGDALLIKASTTLDPATQPNLTVWIRATGEDLQHLTQRFTIQVLPASPLHLDSPAFPENLPAGTPVGTFRAGGNAQLLQLPGVQSIASGNNSYYYIDSQGILWENRLAYQKHPAGSRLTRPSRPRFLSTQVTSVSAGTDHTYFTKSDGSLWGFGSNLKYQLGKQAAQFSSAPVKLFDTGVTKVISAPGGGFMVGQDGSLWALGTKPGFGKPVQHPERILPAGVMDVACGKNHTLILQVDGSLWAMGQNGAGQLGDPHADYLPVPTKVQDGQVLSISANNDYSLFAKADGTVWHMGSQSGENRYGTSKRPLPTPLPIEKCTKVYAGTGFNLFIHRDGSVSQIRWNPQNPGTIQGPLPLFQYGAVEMSGFVSFSIVRMSDGTIWEMDQPINGKGTGNKVPNYTNTIPGTFPFPNLNSAFRIHGNQLVLNKPGITRGYEKVVAYVHSVNDAGHVTGHPIRLEIQEVPEAPTGIMPKAIHFSENTLGGSKVAKLTAIDPDPQEKHTFQILPSQEDRDGQEDSRKFLLHLHDDGTTTLHLRPGLEADYEQQKTFNLEIRASDKDNLQFTDRVEVHLVDVNEPPEGITLEDASLPENARPGQFVGILSIIDPDQGDSHTLALVPNADATSLDNALFQIQTTPDGQHRLWTAASNLQEKWEKQEYNIHLRAKDQGDSLYHQEIRIPRGPPTAPNQKPRQPLDFPLLERQRDGESPNNQGDANTEKTFQFPVTPKSAPAIDPQSEIPPANTTKIQLPQPKEAGLIVEAKGGDVHVILIDTATGKTVLDSPLKDGKSVRVGKGGPMAIIFDKGEFVFVRINGTIQKMPVTGPGRTHIPSSLPSFLPF